LGCVYVGLVPHVVCGACEQKVVTTDFMSKEEVKRSCVHGTCVENNDKAQYTQTYCCRTELCNLAASAWSFSKLLTAVTALLVDVTTAILLQL